MGFQTGGKKEEFKIFSYVSMLLFVCSRIRLCVDVKLVRLKP